MSPGRCLEGRFDVAEAPALLPCPFCGGEARRDTWDKERDYAGCRSCDFWINAAAWNRRITAALAGRDEKINADLLRLARELDGVVEDNHLGVFDRVCAETVSRVRNELIALAAAKEPK